MNNRLATFNDGLLKDPVHSWKFWTLVLACVLIIADIYLQFFVYEDILFGIVSIAILLLAVWHMYSLLSHRKIDTPDSYAWAAVGIYSIGVHIINFVYL